jgi:DNA-binding transcriptional regulator YhcF (GntR family)
MLTNSKIAPGDPQDETSPPPTSAAKKHRPHVEAVSKPVAGHKGHDKWMVAVINAAVGMPPLNFRAAMRLGMFFNCTTGQCNPGYRKLAKEIGCTLDSAKRACRELEADGWLKRKRTEGGHHEDKTQFDLLMPTTRVSREDTPAAGQTAQGRVSKYAATGVQNGQGRVSITDSLMNTENTEKNTERGSAARSEFVDTGKPIDTPARVFDALADYSYPMDFADETEHASKKILAHLMLDEGTNPAEIIAGAEAYGKHASETGERVLPLAAWLKAKGWQQYRH